MTIETSAVAAPLVAQVEPIATAVVRSWAEAAPVVALGGADPLTTDVVGPIRGDALFDPWARAAVDAPWIPESLSVVVPPAESVVDQARLWAATVAGTADVLPATRPRRRLFGR